MPDISFPYYIKKQEMQGVCLFKKNLISLKLDNSFKLCTGFKKIQRQNNEKMFPPFLFSIFILISCLDKQEHMFLSYNHVQNSQTRIFHKSNLLQLRVSQKWFWSTWLCNGITHRSWFLYSSSAYEIENDTREFIMYF